MSCLRIKVNCVHLNSYTGICRVKDVKLFGIKLWGKRCVLLDDCWARCNLQQPRLKPDFNPPKGI